MVPYQMKPTSHSPHSAHVWRFSTTSLLPQVLLHTTTIVQSISVHLSELRTNFSSVLKISMAGYMKPYMPTAPDGDASTSRYGLMSFCVITVREKSSSGMNWLKKGTLKIRHFALTAKPRLARAHWIGP